MVSPEYPLYLEELEDILLIFVNALRKLDCEVLVLSDEKGDGDYKGISPSNADNSKFLI
ncbi:MAG TPA: hypothetical protein VJ583_08145 [Nitrososphaeraceae archaeon]|nr:hypothetical protein [Nitrososphaeraceae archaeon]